MKSRNYGVSYESHLLLELFALRKIWMEVSKNVAIIAYLRTGTRRHKLPQPLKIWSQKKITKEHERLHSFVLS